MNKHLKYFKEPKLQFGFDQFAEDPRDGLLLYGPYESLGSYSLKAGVVGVPHGIKLYKGFVDRLSKPIISKKTVYGTIISDELQRPSFPGFEAVYGVEWKPEPEISLVLEWKKIQLLLSERNKKIRTRKLVELYLSKIVKASQEEDTQVNLWFIIIPRKVYIECRTESRGRKISRGTQKFVERSKEGQLSLIPNDQEYVKNIENLMESSSDFHNLLKAELIHNNINVPVQIIVESTLEFRDKLQRKKYEDSMISHIAWTQSATIYYKLGKLPWRLGDVREKVCYLGLVFKKIPGGESNDSVCSAAQMFLKDGDGAVFRGNIGLWESKNREFHLDSKSSLDLLGLGLDDYHFKWNEYPNEIFIHGRAKFTDEEWEGFEQAINDRNAKTKLTGIIIKDAREVKRNILKLFKDSKNNPGNYGNLRGLAYIVDDSKAYLYSRGFIPRLNTSNTLEIPNPLYVEISRGEAEMDTVLKDILALTKLNYNSCIYGDGLPVTLRFSDKIGGILTATNKWEVNRRQFKHYI